jgi:thiol-disulfide isomerase/thioredoxin
MKRLLLLALVGMILCSIGILAVKIVRGNADKEAAQKRIQTLPDFRFVIVSASNNAADSTAGGSKAFTLGDVPPEKPLVMMHFLPDCHFCQGEAKELAANAAFFSKAHILLVSAAEPKPIRDFGEWYGLNTLPALTLARDSLKTFGQIFGTASVPATFVYGAEVGGKRKLLKQCNGETSAEALRKTLAQDEH